MSRSTSVGLLVLAVVLCLGLSSCSSLESRRLPHVLPAIDRARITFLEKNLPEDCEVFAHLIISIPAALPADQIRQSIEQFAAGSGGDLVLFGLTRQSTTSPAAVSFRFYGPTTPYSFKQKWVGWKFGFSDWNKGGPLVDLGSNHLIGPDAPFTSPIDTQAVLLSCPSVRNSR